MKPMLLIAFAPMLISPVLAEEIKNAALDPVPTPPPVSQVAESPEIISPSGPRHRWVVSKRDTAALAEASRREEIKRLYPNAVYHGPK